MTTSTFVTNLATNYQSLLEAISKYEKRYQRNEHDVQLLAVSKTRSIDEIRAIATLGQKHFAENYVQEAVDKIAKITDIGLTWHFIGPIQKNKTRLIAKNFHWVQSVDREIIAIRLSDQRPENMPNLNVCLQINIDNESSKSGIRRDQAIALAKVVHELPNLTLRGLMVIPAATDDIQQQTAAFAKMASLLDELKQHNFDVDTLSMGMSNDFEAAIASSSTMIRIGTALFGPRHNP